MVDTFKFLAYHTEKCGPEFIRVVHEDEVPGDAGTPFNSIKFLKKTKLFFPSSERAFEDGTRFDSFGLAGLKKEWYKRKMKEAKAFMKVKKDQGKK